MKAIGVVRKIDGLGRVVIPKEVRDRNGWTDGQPLEMFMNDEGRLVLGAYETEQDKENLLEDLESMRMQLRPGGIEVVDRAISAIKRGG